MAAILEVNESMKKNFLQFEPAPRRGEPEVGPLKDYSSNLSRTSGIMPQNAVSKSVNQMLAHSK